jgi:16S rRNA G527 N7-methylase RsmG
VTLVDRRAKRTDELARAVQTLGWNPRVRVVCADTASLVDDPGWAKGFDAAVARGFGPPLDTLVTAVRFVGRGGWVIVSEPPVDQGTRWDHLDSSELGVSAPERCGAVVRFHVER